MVAAAPSSVVFLSICPLPTLLPTGDLSPEGGGFARDRTKPAEFLAPLTAFFKFLHLVVFVSFHASCLKSLTNLGPVT